MKIQLLSLQVAGGLILLLLALQMIFGFSHEPSATPEKGHDIAVFPLAVPSIAGAEAIMAVVLLTDNQIYSISSQAVTACVVVFIMTIIYGLMLLANPILRIIGNNGAAILERVTGMILAALAVELIMQAIGAQRWLR
jgi:multiple antibiotic resistance protein